MSLRGLSIACLVAGLAGAAVLAGYWVWGAGQIEDGVRRWAEEQRARGYEVAFEGPEVDGFPLFHEARLAAPVVGSPGGWRWAGSPLSARAALWDPQTLELAFPGLHRLRRPGPAGQPDVELGLAEAVGTLRLRPDGRLSGLEARLERIELRAPPAGEARAASLRLTVTPAYPERATLPPHFAFTAEVLGLVLPPALAGPLDPEAEFARLEGRLEGVIPDAEPRLALALWRNAGGVLVVDRLKLRWPPLDLEARGRLTLDEGLRPLGELTARIAGLPALLDRLTAQGRITPEQALPIQMVARALASGTNEEGQPVVELPVSFRGGHLFLGPFPLMPLSPVL